MSVLDGRDLVKPVTCPVSGHPCFCQEPCGPVSLHPLIGWLRGMCSDELPHHMIDGKLAEADGLARRLEAERERRAIAVEAFILVGPTVAARGGLAWPEARRLRCARRPGGRLPKYPRGHRVGPYLPNATRQQRRDDDHAGPHGRAA